MENGNATPREKRVVEAEIKMPRLEDLKMPKIDIGPCARRPSRCC